mmetsp:Transcript_21943/g.54321  ORF Transcript_21943/g.54321 Transcript_21943/m.54321 type:complete len:210 (+) Transcript_21943:1614-2243(+)
MDHAVSRLQAHPPAVADKFGQCVVGHHVHGLGVGGGVAERLHDEIGAEAEAREVLELVAGHGACGVLATHGGHLGLAVGARQDAALHPARLADHLLRQREALDGGGRVHGQAELVRAGQTQALARTGGEPAPDDQVDAPPRLHLVQEHVGLEAELAQLLAGAVALGDALVGEHLHHVTHVHLGHVHLDWQGAGVLHGVEEDGGDLATHA